MRRTLRILLRILLSLVLLALLTVAGVVGWFFFYTADLPDTAALAAFSPSAPTTVTTNLCGSSIQILAIPDRDMGMMREAVLAAEGNFDPRGILNSYVINTRDLHAYRPDGTYSVQLARQMICGGRYKPLKRALAEMRTAVHLERRFSHEELLTIYLNRVYFGTEPEGVESAAEHYFGKHPKELSIGESALLAGSIRQPFFLSATQHPDPDRALARRNEVIDAMAQRGSITAEQAVLAKLPPRRTELTSPVTNSAQE